MRTEVSKYLASKDGKASDLSCDVLFGVCSVTVHVHVVAMAKRKQMAGRVLGGSIGASTLETIRQNMKQKWKLCTVHSKQMSTGCAAY